MEDLIEKISLSGTPLYETIIALHQILPKFQKDNGVEKTQCIIEDKRSLEENTTLLQRIKIPIEKTHGLIKTHHFYH